MALAGEGPRSLLPPPKQAHISPTSVASTTARSPTAVSPTLTDGPSPPPGVSSPRDSAASSIQTMPVASQDGMPAAATLGAESPPAAAVPAVETLPTAVNPPPAEAPPSPPHDTKTLPLGSQAAVPASPAPDTDSAPAAGSPPVQEVGTLPAPPPAVAPPSPPRGVPFTAVVPPADILPASTQAANPTPDTTSPPATVTPPTNSRPCAPNAPQAAPPTRLPEFGQRPRRNAARLVLPPLSYTSLPPCKIPHLNASMRGIAASPPSPDTSPMAHALQAAAAKLAHRRQRAAGAARPQHRGKSLRAAFGGSPMAKAMRPAPPRRAQAAPRPRHAGMSFRPAGGGGSPHPRKQPVGELRPAVEAILPSPAKKSRPITGRARDGPSPFPFRPRHIARHAPPLATPDIDAPSPAAALTPGMRDVLRWLTQLDLHAYADVLIRNGFDNLTRLAYLTAPDLEAIGGVKLGHTKQLLHCVGALPVPTAPAPLM